MEETTASRSTLSLLMTIWRRSHASKGVLAYFRNVFKRSTLQVVSMIMVFP
ncbi:MAG: hypothetical protein PVH69_06160 [Desulfobacterales bacterium]